MMMFHMVEIVRVPSVTHDRFEYVWKGEVQPHPSLRKNAVVMNMVVRHQS